MTIAIRACCACFRLLDPPWKQWPGAEPATITTGLCEGCDPDGERTFADVQRALRLANDPYAAEDREAEVDRRQRLEALDRERTERRW